MREYIKKNFWIVLSFILLSPLFSFAQDLPTGDGDGDLPTGPDVPGLTNPLSNINSISDFVEKALTIVRNIGFLVAVFFIVYAGFLFVTARGDEAKLTKAKSAFLWAIVGTAVLLGAWIFATAIQGTVETLKATTTPPNLN